MRNGNVMGRLFTCRVAAKGASSALAGDLWVSEFKAKAIAEIVHR